MNLTNEDYAEIVSRLIQKADEFKLFVKEKPDHFLVNDYNEKYNLFLDIIKKIKDGNKWIDGLPSTKGYYWFYGWMYKAQKLRGDCPNMFLIESRVYGNGFSYWCNRTQSVYPEDVVGMYTQLIPPPRPNNMPMTDRESILEFGKELLNGR